MRCFNKAMLVASAAFCLNLSAYTQNISLEINDVTIKEAVEQLRKNSGYSFIFSSVDVDTKKHISISMKDATIEEVVKRILQGQSGLTYEIQDKKIIVKKSGTVLSQTGKITGKVVDSNGEPIIGATVMEKGTANGTVTDPDGNFTLVLQGNKSLVQISFIGYQTMEVMPAGKPLQIVLKDDTQKIDEVVVTALGIKRQKRSLGYSTTSVNGNEFVQARDPNLGNALSGKIAGVSVTGNATGSTGSSRVVIRGNASMTGNNQPLYVIDGVPFDNTNLGSATRWGGLDMGDGLSNVNADDIENIQVLKGAAASALYGYRGGNGAILITTKSGKKGKPVSIEFNNNLTFNKIYDYRDFQQVYGQGVMGQRPLSIDEAKSSEQSSWGDRMDGQKAINFLGNEYAYSPIDNWKNFYQTGINNVTSAAISGAKDNLTYRFGISNMYDKSILPNSNVSQQGINMNTTYDITRKLHLMVNANYVFEKSKGRSSLSDGNGNTNASLLYHGNSFDIRWMERGGESCDWGTDENGNELLSGTNVYFNNPYWLQYRKTNETNKNRLTGSMTLKYDIFDWLYIQGAVQRDGYNMDFKKVQPIGGATDTAGALTEYSKSYSEMNLNYLVGFDKIFGDWSVGASLGGNRQRNISKQWLIDDGKTFLAEGLLSPNNLVNKNYKKNYTEYQVNSVYATADIGWKNCLFLNLTGRNDWFSTLSPEHNHYFYPSVTLSWVFSDSFKVPGWFTFGKLRASYASASNGTTPFRNYLTYQVRDYSVNGQKVATVNTNTYPNSNLKPVQISEYEIGLNLAFLNNRLSFDMAYYVKNTKDDIAEITTSTASGYDARIRNIGEIRNNGFEFMVNAIPVHTKDFNWNTTFNIAYNNSEVKYLGEGVERLMINGAQARAGEVTVQNIIGSSYGELVGYKYKRTESGQIIYKDGIAQREDVLSSLGNGVYKVTGGWSNQFTYKNFTLSCLVDFKLNADIFSGTNYNLVSDGLHKKTLKGRENDGKGSVIGEGVKWDAATGKYVKNDVAVSAQEYWQGIANNSIGEEFIYDAGFIKLRELSLGYEFPQSVLSKWKAIKGLNVSLVGRNLWTIMKHTDNIDPESAYNNGNGQGLELNGYPATRNFGFNVNIKF